MPRRYVLALDEGTTGTGACVFDERGRLVAKGYHEIRQSYPAPGWVEHDAEEIWRTTVRSARAAIRRARISASSLAAIGVTNQRETVVAWDAKTGRALRPAIVWQDRRTADACAAMRRAEREPGVTAKTGLRLDPYFSGTKIAWMVANDRRVRAARRAGRLRFGTIDSWLIWNLTGGRVHATDPSNASRTLLYDLRRGTYTPGLLELFRARIAELPEIRDSAGDFGTTDGKVLGAPVPILGVAGDQQAALFGQACLRPGSTKNTYGTGCFALVNTGSDSRPARGGLLSTVAWRWRGRTRFALEGAVFIGGAVVQWLRDELRLVKRAADTEAMARSVPDAGGVTLVPAFVGLGAPYWDPYARGLIIGITRGTTRAHLARAALESIAMQSRDVIELLRRTGGTRIRALRVDGGATENAFLMQHQADVLGIPVERAAFAETTAQGAAYLAGLGAGWWTERDIEGLWRCSRRYTPRKSPAWRAREVVRWDAAVARSRDWARAADPHAASR